MASHVDLEAPMATKHCMNQLPSSPWPSYFQPLPEAAHAPSETARVPTTLLDHLAVGPSAVPILVTSCLDGSIACLARLDATQLDMALQQHLATMEVSTRQHLRTIAAQELFVATLDAVEQEVHAPGFNDAVYLYGRMQAQMTSRAAQIHLTPHAAAGRFTVGRLDLLHACATATLHGLLNPSGDRTYQLLVPVAPLAEIQHGRGLALLYPLLDPLTFSSAANHFVLLQIMYDLLARLQADVQQDQPEHPFATTVLPVPSRLRLERDLATDGYVIDGDLATRRTAAPAADSTLR